MIPNDPNDCESKLRELGQVWTNDPAFVDGVIKRIDQYETATDATSSPKAIKKGMNMLKLNIIGLATAATIALALFFWVPDSAPVSASSLSAAIRKAVDDVNTVHVVTYSPDKETGELKAIADTWLARGKGYARLGGGFLQIDDGEYCWERSGKDAPLIRKESRRQIGAFFEMTFPESDYERLPDEDITDSGARLSCYSMKNVAPFKEGPQRVYVYLTPEQRIFKIVTWMFKDEKWNLFNESVYHYDVEVDESVFKPEFDAGVEIIDLDAELEQLADVRNSLFRTNVGGFEYAVHRARALQGGGVMMFATLRPSEVNPAQGFSARIYDSSPQFSDDFRIKLGNTQLNGIDAQWFVRVPRNKQAKWNHITDGKLKLKELFSKRDESDYSINGHEFKDVEIDVHVENWEEPISLEEAAREVYRDQKRIPHLEWTSLDTGVYKKDGSYYGRRGTVDSVTEDEYAKFVVEHLNHWRGRDLADERTAIESAIKRGRVQLTVPGLDVAGRSEFNDKDLGRAASRKDMVCIYADKTAISDDGLELLADLKALKILTLGFTDITDQGLEHLQGIASLEEVNVRGTKVTEAGVRSLQESNPALKIKSDFVDGNSKSR